MRIQNHLIIFCLSTCLFTVSAFASNIYSSARDTIPPQAPVLNPSDTVLPPEFQTIPGITVPSPTQTAPAEEKEELPASAIPWFSEDQLQNPFQAEPNYVDTSLFNYQHYDFATRNSLFYSHKGNPGHAHRNMIFEPDFTGGLNINEQHLYGSYLFSHDELRYYRPKHVFTDLFYITGTGREQLFYAKHAQKMSNELHLNMQYRIINSPGTYSRVATRNANFYLTADYLSPDNRYQALGSFIVNRIFNQESAGLRNHINFEADANRDSVFLYNAESRFREISFNLRHFYQTGFYLGGNDGAERRFINLGRINHDFSYNRSAFVFLESSAPYPFFEYEHKEPAGTFDSTVVHRLENLASWSNFPLTSGRGSFPFNFKVYLKHSLNTIVQPNFPAGADLRDTLNQRIYYYQKENFSQVVQGIELQTDQNRFLSLGGHFNLTLGGYHDEDVSLGAYINLGKAESKQNLKVQLNYLSSEAPYFFNRFTSHYIAWNNDFGKSQTANLMASFTLPWVRLEGNYFLLENMVYLGRDALPVQNPDIISFFNIKAYSDLEFGPFGLRNHLIFQKSTSQEFDRFPDIMSYHSVYMNLSIFQGALVNQFGFDFLFSNSYYAMPYMPIVRGFYIQDEHKLDPQMLVDVFWNGKIKRARLFVKYQNLLGLIPNLKPQYSLPFYPLPETMFKFGVSWMFFD